LNITNNLNYIGRNAFGIFRITWGALIFIAKMREWVKETFADGKVTVVEAGRLATPVARTLDAMVPLPQGKEFLVTITVVEIRSE